MDNADCEYTGVFAQEGGNISLGTGNLHKKGKE